MVFQKHMALEENERQRMDHIKATKRNRRKKPCTTREISCEKPSTRDVHFKLEIGDVPTDDLANGDDTNLKKTTYSNQEPHDHKEGRR